MVNKFVRRVYFRIHLSSLCDLISIVRPSVRGVKRGVKFLIFCSFRSFTSVVDEVLLFRHKVTTKDVRPSCF